MSKTKGDVTARQCYYKVVVIGGGLAGLSAANHLLQHNVTDVCVVEAKGSLGGRILTTATAEGRSPVELGAQWIHGACSANSVFNLANKFKLCSDSRLHEEAGSSIRRWPLTPGYILRPDGIPLGETATEQAYEIFHGILDEVQFLAKHHHQLAPRQTSRLSTFYNGRKKKALEGLRKAQSEHLAEVDLALNGLQRALAIEAGHDLNKVKMEAFAHVTLPGGSANIAKGANLLIEKLAQDIPNILLNVEVRKVDWSFLTRGSHFMPDKISLEIQDLENDRSGFLAADFVICTMPLGYLKRHHHSIFVPRLDDKKVKAIESIGMGQISKLFLEWAEPWWAANEGGLQLAWPCPLVHFSSEHNKEEYSEQQQHQWYRSLCNFAEVENQPNFLCTWLSGQAALTVDHLEEEEILATITDVLRRFTGDPGLPSPKRLIRHQWNLDRFTLGGWAFQSTMTANEDPDILAAPLPNENNPKLLFAGEATHHNFLGNLLGARLSGLREAERVIQKIESLNRLKSLSLNGFIAR